MSAVLTGVPIAQQTRKTDQRAAAASTSQRQAVRTNKRVKVHCMQCQHATPADTPSYHVPYTCGSSFYPIGRIFRNSKIQWYHLREITANKLPGSRLFVALETGIDDSSCKPILI